MGEGKGTPYLEKMGELVEQLKPTELTEWDGQDLAPIREIKTSSYL